SLPQPALISTSHGRGAPLVRAIDRPYKPHARALRLEAQDAALSRRKHGFDSRRARHNLSAIAITYRRRSATGQGGRQKLGKNTVSRPAPAALGVPGGRPWRAPPESLGDRAAPVGGALGMRDARRLTRDCFG